MRPYVIFIYVILLVGLSSAQINNFEYDNQTRQYHFHLPAAVQDDTPLVFILHGYSGSAAGIRDYSDMDQIADEYGFAVCYPQGLQDQWGNRFWNVGYDFHYNQDVNDVGFLVALAAYLQVEYNLSSRNTFCSGMSNGGDMSYMLACQASETFKAVAPVAGCMMEWIYDSCEPVNPIPLFEIHGTNDDITYWNGDMNNYQGYGAYLGIDTAINFWAELNSCTETVIENLPDIYSNDGSYVISKKHTDGIQNNEVWLYQVQYGGHDWPGSWGNQDINASSEIWEFFSLFLSTCELIGDLNNDTVVDIIDLILIVDCILTGADCPCADGDGNNEVNVIDILVLVENILSS